MITGSHVIIYSTDVEADRAFFRDVLVLPAVDAGRGWLIFALPPAEVALHPSDENDRHELYFMCRDVRTLVASLQTRKVDCAPLTEAGWGITTRIRLPGGGQIGLYQPRHPVAAGMKVPPE